jgi:hypothetical protein
VLVVKLEGRWGRATIAKLAVDWTTTTPTDPSRSIRHETSMHGHEDRRSSTRTGLVQQSTQHEHTDLLSSDDETSMDAQPPIGPRVLEIGFSTMTVSRVRRRSQSVVESNDETRQIRGSFPPRMWVSGSSQAQTTSNRMVSSGEFMNRSRNRIRSGERRDVCSRDGAMVVEIAVSHSPPRNDRPPEVNLSCSYRLLPWRTWNIMAEAEI